MRSRLRHLYCALVFDRPWLVIIFLAALLVVSAWFTQYFKLDVSADSLMMDGDPELEYSREISQRYGMSDAVLVSFSPQAPLFSRESIGLMAQLGEELESLERVASVDSLLDVPVFGNTPLTGISEDYQTVMDEDVDLEAAREEIRTSPVFSNAIVSPDGETAALLVNFFYDQQYYDLVNRRTELRAKREGEGLSADERSELASVSREFDEYSDRAAELRHQDIATIRGILDGYRDQAELHLGGAPMIADDLVTFVQSDLATFSIGVFAFIVIALGLIFRRLRWVFLPLACCAVAARFSCVARFVHNRCMPPSSISMSP